MRGMESQKHNCIIWTKGKNIENYYKEIVDTHPTGNLLLILILILLELNLCVANSCSHNSKIKAKKKQKKNSSAIKTGLCFLCTNIWYA